MNTYAELPIDLIQLDKQNPRIANYLTIHREENINSDVMALLLGTSSSSCASLRESIKENGGVIHPIIVNKTEEGSYTVIEGNTRVQMYKDFIKSGIPGKWDTIKAIVYDNLSLEKMHSIRLQAHLVGPREWDSYSKAKYLHHLSTYESMPMSVLISYCGGSSKASEIRNMIAAYEDMEKYYRPLCIEDNYFDPKKFQGFVELQKINVLDALSANGYTKEDFSKWIMNENISVLADVRRIPDILMSKRATQVFLKYNSTEAKKILAVEEITPDSLKDVPYEMLA